MSENIDLFILGKRAAPFFFKATSISLPRFVT
jgi:hypothetical protein